MKEAQHIAEFQRYLDAMDMHSKATCPFVYKQYSSERLLVMERIDGAPLTDLQVCSVLGMPFFVLGILGGFLNFSCCILLVHRTCASCSACACLLHAMQ